jgi:hypothetical protein
MAALASGDRLARLDEGRVYCPFGRNDVDVDWCYTCPSFKGSGQDRTGTTWLRCSGAANR